MEAAANANVSSFELKKRLQLFLDSTVPFVSRRWISFGVLLVLFMLRVVICQGYYVIAYGLGIFLLNAFLAFLTPRFDPELEGLSNDSALEIDAADLPSAMGDEFRPFARRLPEFNFWWLSFRAVVISLGLSFIKSLDIPVVWPILLIYFIVLFALTMRRQIKHMIKFKYIPFDWRKARYTSSQN